MPLLDAFVHPSPPSTAAFVAVVLLTVGMALVGVRRVAPEWTGRALLAAALWLALTAAATLVIRRVEPAVMGFLALCNLSALALAFSPVGRRLAGLPLAALVGFHGFRLPLELILHAWVVGGTLPEQMTWSGQNPDVITGALALLLGLVGLWRPLPRRAAALFSLVGLGLLLNVIRVAVGSAPTPLRSFMNDPPVLLPWFVPFSWIVSVCVAGALCGHVVLLRALWRGRAG